MNDDRLNNRRTKSIMTFSTSAKPLSFYADGETPLKVLVNKFGSRLEHLDSQSKFCLVATIALCAAVDQDSFSLVTAFSHAVRGSGAYMDVDLYSMLCELDSLSADSLLGLCEALISQLRYTKEVK